MFAARGGFFYQGGGTPPPVTFTPWLGLMVPATTSGTYANSVLDGEGNMYSIGIVSGATPDYSTITKIDKDGNLVWQKYASQSGQEIRFYAITNDLSGNIYVAGQRTSTQFNLLIKFDTDGVEQWSQLTTIEYDGQYQSLYATMAYDNANDRIYVSNGLAVVSFNGSDGTWSSRNRFTFPAAYTIFRMQVDSGVLSCAGTYDSTLAGYYRFTLGTGGVIAGGNVNTIDRVAYPDAFSDLYVDDNDTYLVGYTRSPTALTLDVPFVAKYTNGDLVWQKYFNTLNSQSSRANRVWLDSSNNIYVGGSYLANTALIFFKLDTDGNLLWYNGMNTGATGNEIDRGIFYYNDGVYFSSDRTSGSTTVYGSVPSDGSIPGTGSYTLNGNTITYTTLTQAANAGDLTAGYNSVSSIQTDILVSQSSAGLTFTTGSDAYYETTI